MIIVTYRREEKCIARSRELMSYEYICTKHGTGNGIESGPRKNVGENYFKRDGITILDTQFPAYP